MSTPTMRCCIHHEDHVRHSFVQNRFTRIKNGAGYETGRCLHKAVRCTEPSAFVELPQTPLPPPHPLIAPRYTWSIRRILLVMRTSCSVSSSAKQNAPHAVQGTTLRTQPPSISCLANSLMITASPQRVQLLRRLGQTSARCRSRSAGSRRLEQSSQGSSLHVERMCCTIWERVRSSAHSGHLRAIKNKKDQPDD